MKPPAYPAHPPMGVFGKLWKLDPEKAIEAARLNARLIARMVRDGGATINCVPMLDTPQLDADPVVIGDRALATHTDQIIALGRAVVEGTLAGGALPVVKHMPGHGRALADSHFELPRIVAPIEDLRAVDFKPFVALNDAAAGMTAHLVYDALDPERPATLSPMVIDETIRKEIGFDGLLISDDLKMKALGGPLALRARDCLAAGCDMALCCNFDLADKVATAENVSPLAGEAARRADAAVAATPAEIDPGEDGDHDRLAALIRPGLLA